MQLGRAFTDENRMTLRNCSQRLTNTPLEVDDRDERLVRRVATILILEHRSTVVEKLPYCQVAILSAKSP